MCRWPQLSAMIRGGGAKCPRGSAPTNTAFTATPTALRGWRRFSRRPSARARTEHDLEKCAAVFPRDKRGTRLRGDHAQSKGVKRDDDSTQSHCALAEPNSRQRKKGALESAPFSVGRLSPGCVSLCLG